MNVRDNTKRFFAWLEPVVRNICDHPSHMQRLGIIGAGMVMYPTVLLFAGIVWLGYARTPELQSQSLNFMGMALLSSMALWGLVVVAILGVVKGVSVSAPGGLSVGITTTADDPDVDPSITRVDVDVDQGRRGGRI